jgi:hypothetical protein
MFRGIGAFFVAGGDADFIDLNIFLNPLSYF